MSLTLTQVTYTEAQANLDELCEQVISDREAIVITRKDGENVALIAADELSSLLETVYLLRSPPLRWAQKCRSLIKCFEASKGPKRWRLALSVQK